MFERRLWTLLIATAIAASVLVGRLFQLQVLHGSDYREQADAVLVRAPADLPAIRGRILDRAGHVLASDEPTMDVCVNYGALAWSDNYVTALVRAIRREPNWHGHPTDEIKAEAFRRVDEAGELLRSVTGMSREQLKAQGQEIQHRVEGLRHFIGERRRAAAAKAASQRSRSGAAISDASIHLAEDDMLHPLIRDVSLEARAKLELQLTPFPFLRLEPAVRRVYRNAADMIPLAHLLGHLGQVSPEQIARSASDADTTFAYRPGDLVGVSGVERLAEQTLCGRRGRETRDLDGHVLERTDPVDGRDVRLTIDTDLQARIYEILRRAVAANSPSTGAACAVLALPSRECLSLVSYPSYDPQLLATDYARLRDDTRHQPLRPRAIANAYPPGSIIKPATLLSGIASGRISEQFTVECRGQLFPNLNAWHCWTFWNHLPPHGVVNGITAIQHSCNVFFYTVGERLGPIQLTDGFRGLIYGPTDGASPASWRGTGLREEAAGLVPSEAALNRVLTAADARNFAIGQGEVLVTPIQAANLMATIAEGDYLDPTIVQTDSPRSPRAFAHIPSDAWRMAREGMYRCVNSPGGTAYGHLTMNSVVVCGKTGSAESVPLVLRRDYVFADTNGVEQTINAPTVEAAREMLKLPGDARPVRSKPTETYPKPRTEGKKTTQTHAWCAAFAPRDEPRIALAVMLEYAGGGGKIAAPVAKEVFEALLDCPQGYLPRDGRTPTPAENRAAEATDDAPADVEVEP